ncbi:MAG: cation:proton antiporter [Maricaulis sp.]|jgi:multicomponent Na+:H+ antiporter subunit B|nr:cation:proton antiporter [Maricaulis sp.]HAQ35978.1 cation:proton antiporter [Alphaproteobacteria bacterium]
MDGFDWTQLLDYALMAMLLAVGFAIVRLRNLFAAVMLMGVYSLVSAAWFVSLDAVDVAFTEAAVGAGISTVLMLAAMLLTAREAEPVKAGRHWAALIVVAATGAALFFAIGDMPSYGDASAPANAYVGFDYLIRTPQEIAVPNVVTAVLASYRGFDTLGETVVIFAAGLGVMLLLGFGRRKPKKEGEE